MKKNFWPLLFLVSSITSYGQQAKYVKDQLFFKVKDDFRKELPLFNEIDNSKIKSQKSIFDKEVLSVINVFNSNTVLENKKASKLQSEKFQRIYAIKVKDSTKIDNLIDQLTKLSFIEYVERIPLYEIFYTPNDINSYQWNITKTRIPQAWDLSKGVSTVVIAIVDDAVRIDHEDLAPNIWINPKETANNGIDDDANGYIDDINGFDVADFDNNPTTPASATNSEFTHGTHCAGIASAKTDNGKGIVSPGFSTKIMAVKTKPNSDLGASLPFAYDGLEYAIASGAANVISMSWGGYGKSNTYQLLINYAHSQGIVLVAAAGNSSTTLPMYPASYNHVISVGATDIDDKITYFSNYGSTLDIMAPGLNIWSTLAGSTSSYGYLSGTSMACPLVAGIYGLMLSYAPGSSPDFLESCMKSSADNINALNTGYIGQIGAGRINAQVGLACLKGIPLADFVATTTSICVGQSVNFYDKSNGSGISSWAWTFTGANITSSTVKNPLITYSTPGTYPVSLKVTNTAGSNTITKLAYITVYQPTASISGSATINSGQSTPLQFDFTGNNPYKVSFSDGTTITSLSGINYTPYYVYVSPTISKTYTISSFSDGSCSGSKSGSASILVATVTASGCDISTGLVAYYPLDGNANDLSGNNFNALISGTSNSGYSFVTDRNSISNKALSISGGINGSSTAGYITLPNFFTANKLSITGDFSISMWVNVRSTAYQWARFFDFAEGTWTANGSYISGGLYDYTSGVWTTLSNKTSVSFSQATNPLPLNTWQQVAFVKTGNNMNIFINGCLQGSTTISGSNLPTSITSLLIGKSNRSFNDGMLSAYLDEIRIYNRAINNCEIQQLYGNTVDCKSVGLVAHYPFCGNANDVSGNNNTGTVAGAALTTDRFGNANSSYTFNGVDQSISIGNKSSLKMATGLSISLWIKPYTIPTTGIYNLISDHAPGEAIDGSGKILRFAGTEIQFIVYGVYAFGTAIYSKYNFSTTAGNTWHHLVGTYDSKVVKLYIDGILVDQVINSFPIAINSNPLLIGKSGYGEYFNGQIDDIRIFNRALTSNEVQGFFIEPAPCTNTGLVASYPFCGNANDVSGNNINGTVSGANLTPDRFGNINSAYSFNGVNNTISFSKVPTSAIDNWAISAWIKPAAAIQGGMVISNGFDNGGIGDGYSFGMANANGGSFTAGSNLVELYCGVSFFNTGYILNANSWYHVVMQREAGTLKIYVNGTLLSYTNNSSIPKTPTSFTIGSQNGLRYFNGAIDDIKIYSKALSNAEIQALYNEPAPCPTNTITSNCTKALDFIQPESGPHVRLGKGFNVPNTFTIQSWVKLHSLTSTGFYDVFSKHISATYLGSYLFYIDNRIPTFYITGVGNVAYTVTANSPLDDIWHHIAGTYDGSTMKIYIDGTLNNSFNIICNINQTNSVNLLLGTADDGTGISLPSLDGSMDEPAIFSKTLTQTEIQSYMNGGIPTTTSGLMGYWKFEENDPLICYNSVLGGVNGTIAGNAIRTYDTPFGQAGINCGLVASYPFCGNANDVSGNNYNGTVTGSTLISDRFGNANSAYYFNGSGTSTLDHNIKFSAPYGNSKTPFSLSFWAKADADVATSRSYPTLLNLYNNITSLTGENARLSWINMILGNAYASNVIGLNSFVQFPQSGGNVQLNSTTVPSTNVWNHFVNTYDPNSNRMQLFINGKLNNSINISGTANPNLFNCLIIGREYDGGNNSYIDTYYKGALDDIKVYTRVLTNTEVQTLYNEPAPCTTTGLVASYPFCGNANDVSGNKYNGTVTGANLTIDRFGNPNSAYLFNGLNSIIKVNNFPVFFLNNFSLSIWLKNTGDAGGQTYDSFLAYGSTQANHSLTYSYDRANTNFSYYDKTNGSYFFNNSANSPKDAWAHIAIVYKNGIAYNYVNGILKDQKVISNAILDGDNLLSIGAFIPDNQYFTGSIDDIKIYNKDLTSGEVLALYNEPAPCITCTVTVTPAILGNQTICTNGIENYSIPTISGINYTWSVTGGNLLKQNGNLASATWTGQGIFTLSGIPSSTCVGISKLTVTVGCCTLTPVKADFIVNTNSCTGQSFSLTNTSINTSLVSTYLWDFGPDAVPSQSTLPNPSFIYYKNAGQKVITLKVLGSGCKQSDTKTDTLFFFPVPFANAGPDIYLCTTLGQSIGSLPISDNQYVWHPGKYLADSTKSQTTITGFYNGGLVLEVRYGESNCVGYDTVQVYQFPTVTPVTQAICRGETVRLNTSFWNNSVKYSWSPTSYIYSNFGNYILVKPDRDTTFNLSINSISGCGIASAKIKVEQKYTLEANYSPRKYCANDSVTLQVTNPRAIFDYTWLKYADSTIFKNGVSVKFAYNRTGIQSKVIESSLCKNTLIVPIQVLDSTFVNTYTPVVETLCIEPTLTISSSLAQNQYLWSTGETSNSTKASTSGLYWVKTYNFCEEHVDSFYVIIKTVDNYFPNVFTPNEDQKNDVLIFEGCAFHTEDVSIEIFDRWGGKVYSNNAYKQDWTAKGVPSGMYYYILKSSQSGELGKGWLQIIK